MTIEEGDLVQYIDTEPALEEYFDRNKTYVVLEVWQDMVKVQNESGKLVRYFTRRFELVAKATTRVVPVEVVY